ncbi:MAG: cytochrome P450 [Chloroflexi bacterium]|nr:cytochrome P450 [Chloroflexota bacterium]
MTDAPGITGLLNVFQMNKTAREAPHEFIDDLWQRFGDVAQVGVGPLTLIVLARAEHVKHVLVTERKKYIKGRSHDQLRTLLGNGLFTSEGEFWHRQRRLMAPTFTPAAVSQYIADVVAAVEEVLGDLDFEGTRQLDVQPIMTDIAMNIIMRTMFSSAATDEERIEALQPALAETLSHVSERTAAPVINLPTPANRRYRKHIATIDDFINRIIEERRSSDEQHDDLLGLLMQAREEGQGMTDAQLRDEVLITFFAGHETTAQALTFTLYLLAENPACQRRVRDEIGSVLYGGQPVTPETLDHLDYTQRVIKEALRLYPPVAMFARDAAEEDEIDGYTIPKGAMVMLSQWITHRHADYWSEPYAFNPDRWLPGRGEPRHPYAYFPFGSGQRTCLGKSFAEQEMLIVLALLMARCTFAPLTGFELNTEYGGTLRPADGMPLAVTRQ